MKNNTIGRITCPVCGEPLQDLRVDKNNKLYMYCDNLCVVKFNGKMSKKYLPLLMSGQSVTTDKMGVINSIKPKENINDVQWKQPRNNTGIDRATTDGRTDGQPAASTGVQRATGTSGRGWFAELLADDDE